MSFGINLKGIYCYLNVPFAGFAARVVRARGGLRAVRREGGGGDRHASPPGEPVLLRVPVWCVVGSGSER